MIIREFEQKIQELFEKAVDALPKEERWKAERNVFSEMRSVEADMVISKEGLPYAIVEIKSSTRPEAAERGQVMARRIAAYFNAPFFFVATPTKFIFSRTDGFELAEKDRRITPEDIISLLSRPFERKFDRKEWQRQISEIEGYVENTEDAELKKKEGKILQTLESLKNPDNYSVNDETGKVELTPETEQKLFDSLLGLYKKKHVCRFTTLASLFRTVNNRSQSMSSIVSMNDKSETSYATNYLMRQGFGLITRRISGPADWNNTFITSCCDQERENDVTMLRLYADDAKGVCIRYKIDKLDKYPGFILRPVSYQRKDGTHPELEIVIQLLNINVNSYTLTLPALSIWQHFFKPKEYEFEKEVRLLYRKDQIGGNTPEPIWILNEEFNIISPIITFSIKEGENAYPLQIEALTLGPKMREAETNAIQLSYLLGPHAPEPLAVAPKVTVTLSDITHYR
ncbi:MAG: DUF2971 domain-containing protein [Muribaculaceae bacterium]|nr:DUF2971 domain-containing protein [Muribaculaceae bacterium]